MQDRSFTYPHKDSFHRILGHMVHHRRNVVCDGYGEPFKIQGRKMEASCHSEIDFQNCCTDWVRHSYRTIKKHVSPREFLKILGDFSA